MFEQCLCVHVGQGEGEERWIYTTAVCFPVILIFATELWHLQAAVEEVTHTWRRDTQPSWEQFCSLYNTYRQIHLYMTLRACAYYVQTHLAINMYMHVDTNTHRQTHAMGVIIKSPSCKWNLILYNHLRTPLWIISLPPAHTHTHTHTHIHFIHTSFWTPLLLSLFKTDADWDNYILNPHALICVFVSD